MFKQWKKEQASGYCTADVCLHQSVNQLYNNNKMAILVLFSTVCSFGVRRPSLGRMCRLHAKRTLMHLLNFSSTTARSRLRELA